MNRLAYLLKFCTVLGVVCACSKDLSSGAQSPTPPVVTFTPTVVVANVIDANNIHSRAEYERLRIQTEHRFEQLSQMLTKQLQQELDSAWQSFADFDTAQLAKLKQAVPKSYAKWIRAKKAAAYEQHVALEKSVPEIAGYLRVVDSARMEYRTKLNTLEQLHVNELRVAYHSYQRDSVELKSYAAKNPE
ncbi:MAG: hypothetical protein JWO40_853 [Candidatus Doudnabacteria bacterium]|nr:hypothetical protein [Candidatus Doudnabacteria bacterium]